MMKDNYFNEFIAPSLKNEIKTYFKKYSSPRVITNSVVEKFLKNYKNIDEYLDTILIEEPNFENKRNIIISILFDINLKHCLNCRKVLKFSKNDRNYCSSKCSNSSKLVKKLKEDTFLKHYGVSSNLKSEKFRHQSKETCLKKYGVDHPLKNENIFNKVKQTCLEKYGNEFLQQNTNFKNKSKRTCTEKYGVENYSYLKTIETIIGFKNYVVPLFDLKNIKNIETLKWKCVKCGNEFEQKLYTTGHIKEYRLCPRCLNCYPFISGYSYKEKELVDFCKQYFHNLKENDKQLIKPLELDIVIDELKLAIEFNGSYWHDVNHVSKGYHLNKVLKCNSVGYRLIHIWEDEWNESTKEKLIDIFTNKEIIDFSKPLDRSWYNNLDSDFEELQPEIIIRDGFEVENCGYLVYIKNKKVKI